MPPSFSDFFIEASVANAILNYDAGFGPDCMEGTPDDDDNNIGDDECPMHPNYDWDQGICDCVIQDPIQCDLEEYGPYNWCVL